MPVPTTPTNTSYRAIGQKGKTKRDTLKRIIAEFRSRGLEVPPELLEQMKGILPTYMFKKSPNGYYMGMDSRIFNANPKQDAFVNTTARFSFLCAGRGCIAPETLIDGIPVADIHSNIEITTLYGKAWATTPFLKGKANLYSVKMSMGAEVLVTEQHRFLTPVGWLPLNRLQVGDSLLSDGTWYEQIGKEIKPNSLDYYSLYFHLNDELHILSERVALNILQQLHMIAFDNNAQLAPFHLSIVDFLAQQLYQFFLEYSISPNSYEQLLHQFQDHLLFLYNSCQIHIDEQQKFYQDVSSSENYSLFQPQEVLPSCRFLGNQPSVELGGFLHLPKYVEYSLDALPQTFLLSQFDCQSNKNTPEFRSTDTSSVVLGAKQKLYFSSLWNKLLPKKYSSELLLSLQIDFALFSSKLLHNLQIVDDQFSSLLPPESYYNYNTFFDKIDKIKFIRFGDFYDLSVPTIEHYSAQGIFHHNSGKTACGAQKALKKLEQGWCGVVGNPDFENLKISTWPEFARWCDYQMVVPKQRHRLQPDWQPNQPFKLNFNNGAWAIFKGIKDPDSARGPNVNWFWYDEPGRGDPLGQDWQIANASVRVGKDPQAWATGTPVGKDHWLYRFFIQQEIPEEAVAEFQKISTDRQLMEVIITSVEDNKENLDPFYFASLLAAYPEGWLRRQELYGEFVDQGGVLGNREWFDGMIVPSVPTQTIDLGNGVAEVRPDISGRIRFWDLAASERKIVAGKKINDPDETVGTLMSWRKSGPEYYIEDQVAGCWAWDDLKREIMTTAWKDGPMVRQIFEEEPGSGGKNQVAELTQLLLEACPGYPMAMGWRPEGDKVMRANVWFAEAAQKKIYLVSGEWNGKFLDQLSSFPIARHDDRIDSVSGARFNLAPIRTWRQTKFLHL